MHLQHILGLCGNWEKKKVSPLLWSLYRKRMDPYLKFGLNVQTDDTHMHQERMSILIIIHITVNMVVSKQDWKCVEKVREWGWLGSFTMIRIWDQNEGCLWIQGHVVWPPHRRRSTQDFLSVSYMWDVREKEMDVVESCHHYSIKKLTPFTTSCEGIHLKTMSLLGKLIIEKHAFFQNSVAS